MRSLLTFSSRSSRRLTLVALLALAATMLNGVPAQAADATQVELSSVDGEMTANRDISSFTVTLKDGTGAVDTGYTGTVTFTAAGCTDCFDISEAADPFTPLANDQYTFDTNPITNPPPGGPDDGSKELFIRWNEDAVGERTLQASATLTTGGPAQANAPNTTEILSNDPQILELTGVESQATEGVADPFTVTIRNDQGDTPPNTYTNTVIFSASCDECFTVSPNDGTGNEDRYTFVSGDNATKSFTLTWNENAIGDNRTFTATDDGLLETQPSDSMSPIDVEADPTTTTTTTSNTTTTTTSTTLPTTTTSTSTTTTSTSTTTTTAPPRTKVAQIVHGAGAGGGPHVVARRAANPGNVTFSYYAYASGFTGGVRVATGDVNNDGYDDIITAAGPGGGPHILVWNGKDAGPKPGVLMSFYAYGAEFTGGVYVASADVNNDGRDDIITGPDAGGGPHVRVFSAARNQAEASAPAELLGFMAYGTEFTGGVRVAGGRFDVDGFADVVTAPGPGGGPHVRLWAGDDGTELGGFMAYGANFTGGVFVGADRADEGIVYTGAGPGGGRHVRLFDSEGEIFGFMAGIDTNGAMPAVGESTGQASDVFVVSRAVNNSGVQFFSLEDGHEFTQAAFAAYPGVPVGVFVAVGVL